MSKWKWLHYKGSLMNKEKKMFDIHYYTNNTSEYNYKSFGSLSQVIEGARVKSMQIPILKHKEWLVLFKQGSKIIASSKSFA